MKTCKYARYLQNGRMNIFLHVLFVAVLSQLLHPAFAQNRTDSLHPERAYMLATGVANTLDTYLSAEKYKGTELRYITTTTRNTRWNGISQTFLNEGYFDIVSNRADNNDEVGGMYRFQYHLRRHWDFAHELTIEAGGGIGTQIGLLYNTRNSNNPVQAYANIQFLPSAAASQWTHLFRWPVRFRYEVCVPLLGVMFSPNYGQSYYEIFSRGNYDHNIVPTTIAATPSLRHMLIADFPISKRKTNVLLRVGYLGDYQQTKVNHLKQHQYTHLLVLGFTMKRQGN